MRSLRRRGWWLAALCAAGALVGQPARVLGQNPFDAARKPEARVEVWLGPASGLTPLDIARAQPPGPRPEPAPAHPPGKKPPAPKPRDAAPGPAAPDPLGIPAGPVALHMPAWSDMQARAGGFLGALTGEAIIDLRRAVDPARATGAEPPPPVITIRVLSGVDSRDIEVSQRPDGTYVGTVAGGGGAGGGGAAGRRFALKAEVLDRALGSAAELYWGVLPGPMVGGEVPGGPAPSAVELPKPYVHGRFALDARTLERVQGAKAMYAPAQRVLASERFFARLPSPHEPRRRAGLIVWMDPTPGGRPPAALCEAADALHCIVIGAAGAGNDRPVVERLQLGLDAVATASRRYLIDPARVYLVGVSGGGKMSTILLAGFPEVFSGAVPIVGLSWYERIPTGQGGKVWPPEFIKPTGERWTLLASRRLAAVTGANDFNYEPIMKGVELFERDRLAARLYDVPNLGHEMPAAAVMGEVLTWVDERVLAARVAQNDEATRVFDALPAEPEPRRKGLRALIATHPWTASAWAALDELRAGR